MSHQYQLPFYRFSGSAKSMGEDQAEVFKKQFRELVRIRLDHICEYKKVSLKGLKRQLNDKVKTVWFNLKNLDPHAHDQAQAFIKAANVDPFYYMVCANITDFKDQALDPEGCTSIVFCNDKKQMMGAQTWDLQESNLPYVTILHEIPDHGLERYTLNCLVFPH